MRKGKGKGEGGEKGKGKGGRGNGKRETGKGKVETSRIKRRAEFSWLSGGAAHSARKHRDRAAPAVKQEHHLTRAAALGSSRFMTVGVEVFIVTTTAGASGAHVAPGPHRSR